MTFTHSDSITALMGAMLKVQGTVDGVRKDSKNPHFRSSYASLESVVDTIRPACQAEGLVVTQALGEYRDGCMSLTTMVVHAKSGEWMSSEAWAPVSKPDPQGVGSAQTYLSRYSLMAAFNLPPVDDDGNAASGNGNAARAVAASTKFIPNKAEEMVTAMIDRVNMAQTLDALTATKKFEGFREDYKRLSPDGKRKVEEAIAHREAELQSKMMEAG